MGLPAEYALGAASWRARAWLGWNATLDEGAPADFVVVDRDPLADLTALREPVAVVLRSPGGRRPLTPPTQPDAFRGPRLANRMISTIRITKAKALGQRTEDARQDPARQLPGCRADGHVQKAPGASQVTISPSREGVV
ncbi:MAG: hypothetical protein R2734_12415 [Nocardioides sp.]